MNRSWKLYVTNLCCDAWNLSPRRIQRVIEGLEFLIASDQLSDMSVAGVLSEMGMSDPAVTEAAHSIRTTIRDAERRGAAASTADPYDLGAELFHTSP